MAELETRHQGSKPRTVTLAVQAKVLHKNYATASGWQYALVLP
jgi:hypothetical protein